jgi:GT2 family glycosyltransferase
MVPVYSNLDLVAACLESVIAAGLDGARLLIVNDGAVPALASWLESFSREHGAELVSHDRNRGFVEAVNTGLAQAVGADVVLLNSDTVVHSGWWQRLRDLAHADHKTGTVTPLSNNGDICSYPLGAVDDPLDGAGMDALCQSVNGHRAVEVPTGVGFCLYLRGDCLAEVGSFDAEAFGRGYGEENDFCMRAAAKGWKHLCHTGVYVEHVGGASFGAERDMLMARGDQILAQRYPHYGQLIEDFLHADPLADARDALTLARLENPDQRSRVVAEYDVERRERRRVQRSQLVELRNELTEFNARCDEYEALTAELRVANASLLDQFQTLEANHAQLSQELERVRAAFSETDSQLVETRTQLSASIARGEELQQQLAFTTRERDDYAAEVDRLNALWPLRLARRVKRILRL